MGDYLVVSLLNQQCVTVRYVNYLLHNKEQSTISKLLISLNRNYKIQTSPHTKSSNWIYTDFKSESNLNKKADIRRSVQKTLISDTCIFSDILRTSFLCDFMYLYRTMGGVIKFVNDLRQNSGFLWVLRFPPPIKLTATL
jgi:hypothetical protein